MHEIDSKPKECSFAIAKDALGPILYLILVRGFGSLCLFCNITAMIDSVVKCLADACQSRLTTCTSGSDYFASDLDPSRLCSILFENTKR